MRPYRQQEASTRDTHIIQSLDKGLFVLELIEQVGHPIGLSELKQKLGWDKATVHRILATLERRGYILRNPSTKGYSLGLKLYGLYDSLVRNFDIHEATRPLLVEVARETGESTHLAVAVGKEIVFIDQIPSSEVLSVNTQIGARQPLYCTALGRAVLARVPPAELTAYIPQPMAKYTAHTITRIADLRAALQIAREKEFAVDNEEFVDGIKCVAAPIVNDKGQPVAAIGISGPANRITVQNAERFGRFIRDAAAQISRRAGWTADSAAASALKMS